MLEVGKLYSCSGYYLMLYPDKEGAVAAADHFATVHHAASTTAYWTRKLGKLILYVEKNVPLLVLTVEEKYVEVLAGDRKGWIVYRDWLDIEEIVDEAA